MIDNTIYALVSADNDIQLVRLDMQGKELGYDQSLTADMPERIISASASKAGDK